MPYLTSWRNHLFGPRAHMGYDHFVTPPRARHQIPCRVCGTACLETRDVFGRTGHPTGLGEGDVLHDRFECPHRAHSWHLEALSLVRHAEATSNAAVRRRLFADLEEILRRQHMPLARAS